MRTEQETSGTSRRRFLKYAGAVVVVGAAGLGSLGLANELTLGPKRDYSAALSLHESLTQPLPPAEIRYPGFLPIEVGIDIEIADASDAPLKDLAVRQHGLDGFQFTGAQIGESAITPTKVGNDLMFILPERLEAGRKLVLNLSYLTGWDSKTSDANVDGSAEATYYDHGGILPAFLDPHEGLRSQNVTSKGEAVTVKTIPDPTALRELHDQRRNDRLVAIRDKQMLLQFPFTNEVARDEYWRDPSSGNGKTVLEELSSELAGAGEPYGELGRELMKLPDLQGTIDEGLVKAGENVACDALLPSDQGTIQSRLRAILDEGIKDKRGYDSALQAAFWLRRGGRVYNEKSDVYSEKSDPFLRFASVSDLVWYSWENSPVSNSYTSERWQDFDEVVHRLISPELVGFYMRNKNNMEYEKVYGRFQTALETFERKKGACGEQSMFAAYCLAKNGWEANVLGVFPYLNEGGGHAVTLFKYPGTKSVYFCDYLSSSTIQGPYSSVHEAANFVNVSPLGRDT